MNAKANAKLKDHILKLINNQKCNNAKDIAVKVSQNANLIRYLCEEFNKENLCELIEVTSSEAVPTKDYLITPTNKGFYLLEFNGGFTRVYKREVLKKCWVLTKITAAVLNAVAILVIGLCSIL